MKCSFHFFAITCVKESEITYMFLSLQVLNLSFTRQCVARDALARTAFRLRSPLFLSPGAFADLHDRTSKFPSLGTVKYAAQGKYVSKLLCFALVKSWCRSRDKRIIKRDRAAEEETGERMEFRGKESAMRRFGYNRLLGIEGRQAGKTGERREREGAGRG